jgi:G3E family GTPase
MSIPLRLITGFLGSGKTTFLMNYLDAFSLSRKIGVIQNEFSSSSIDGQLIRQMNGGYKMLEINNGSVFCVCLLGSFIDSLAAFIEDNNPDEIIMEASGMSDPISIGQIFQSVKLRNKVYLDYSWTIVDARNFLNVKAIRSRIEHQIRIANTVMVNKIDIAGNDTEAIIEAIEKINPFALVEKCSFACINFDWKKNTKGFLPFEDSSESCKPDLQSIIIKSSRIISPENLKLFIGSIKVNFIRVKGYVNTDVDKKVVVQGIFNDYSYINVDWFPEITELIGIGTFDDSENYTRKFETYCK